MLRQPSIAVVIVNYRTPGLVIDCLRSLLADDQELPVIVVDNASGDDSITLLSASIRSNAWKSVELRSLERNGGFAFGNNAAIRELLASAKPPDYLWLLNPDTIVRPGACRSLGEFLELHPNAGIAGSRLVFPDGRPQTAAFRFPSLAGEFEDTFRLGVVTRLLARFRVPMPPAQDAHRCDWVNGASMMVRREVFESIGLMDEGYFLYFEETDLCKRIRDAGWEVWHVPASRVVHLEGQSTEVTGTNRAKNRRPRYWFDSRARYFRKHHPGAYAFAADLVWIVSYGSWQVQRLLRGKPDPDPPKLWSDFVRHAMRRWS